MMLPYILIGITLLIALFELFHRYYKSEIGNHHFIFILLLLLISSITSIFILYDEDKTELATREIGEIENSIDNIIIGTVGFSWENNNELSLINITGIKNYTYGSTNLFIRTVDGKNKISMDFVNTEGEIVCKIIDNVFYVNTPALIWNWQKNEDDQSLEIVDENFDVIIQIVYEENYAIINCVYHLENGYIFIAGKHGMGQYQPSEKISDHIDRIFKYPSALYPGERR